MFFVNFVVQLMTTGMIHEVTAMNLNLIRTTTKDKLLNDVRMMMKEMMKTKRTTHYLSHGVRNMAPLLIFTMWALGDHVAPGHQIQTGVIIIILFC